jgi:hypothetical protein
MTGAQSHSQSAGCPPPTFPGTGSPRLGAGAANRPLRTPAPTPMRIATKGSGR